MIKLENVNKYYILKSGHNYHALKNINLNLYHGEFVAVVGKSGSGKTTLLNILGNLDTASNGSFHIEDVDTKNYSKENWDDFRNHRIGFIFQKFYLFNHLTVYENIELPLILSGYCKEERRIRVVNIIKKVGLFDHINKKPGYLSGGEQQRVVIARAVIKNPDIILADEPTGQLDKKTAKEIIDLISAIGENKLVIIVTHMEKLISSYATRVIKIKDGEIVEDNYIIRKETDFKYKVAKSKLGFKNILYLSFQNIIRKLTSSIILMSTLCLVFSLILSMIVISQKNVQNDIYQFLASDSPMNLVEVSKTDQESFTSDEINKLKNIPNVQSVIPQYNESLIMKANDNFVSINGYEILPQNLHEFYLMDSLVCGDYPTQKNEVIININTAIAIVDDDNSLYSRYDMNMVTDKDIWELVKNKQLNISNENNQNFIFNIVGILSNKGWNYSTVNIYFHSDKIADLMVENSPIDELNIYISKIDEQSRKDTMDSVKALSDNYEFNPENIYTVNSTYDKYNKLNNFVEKILIVLIIISVISIVALINYFVYSRIKNVGILKSLGANSKDIQKIYSMEFLYISLVSITFSYFLSSLFINLIFKISSNLYSSSRIISSYSKYPNLLLFLLVGFVGIFSMYFSSIIPIHITTRKPIIDILRKS